MWQQQKKMFHFLLLFPMCFIIYCYYLINWAFEQKNNLLCIVQQNALRMRWSMLFAAIHKYFKRLHSHKTVILYSDDSKNIVSSNNNNKNTLTVLNVTSTNCASVVLFWRWHFWIEFCFMRFFFQVLAQRIQANGWKKNSKNLTAFI